MGLLERTRKHSSGRLRSALRKLGVTGSSTKLASPSPPPAKDAHHGVEESDEPRLAACAETPDHLLDKRSLWDRAYDALKENDAKLVENYEKLLFDETPTAGACIRSGRCLHRNR